MWYFEVLKANRQIKNLICHEADQKFMIGLDQKYLLQSIPNIESHVLAAITILFYHVGNTVTPP